MELVKWKMDVGKDLTGVFISFSLSPIVLCTHVLALYLLKKDRSFGNIQKYLLATLSITEVFSVVILLIRGIDQLYSWFGFKVATLFGEATVYLMYFFVMIFITWDRFAEIKLNLKYSLYCNSKKAITLLVITFVISLSLFVVLLSMQFITNREWYYNELYLTIFVFPIFHGIFIISAVFVYSYIFKKLRKSQILQLKIRRQLQLRLQMNSLNSKNAVNLNSKPKLVVPSLIVLTFLIFSTLPHCLLLVLIFSGWNNIFNFIPMLYLFGFFVDPVIYILSVKSLQKLFRKFLRFLK